MENETMDREALGNSLLESLREDGYREANIVYQQTLALISECSRLASRVEELEQEIADRDAIICGLQDLLGGKEPKSFDEIKKRLKEKE